MALPGLGGKKASPPKLNINQSARLLNRQLKIFNRWLPRLDQTAGDASREEYGSNTALGLQMLTNPAQALYGADAKEITDRNRGTQKQIAELRGKLKGANAKQRKRINNQIAKLQRQIDSRNQQASALLSRDPGAELAGAFGQEFAKRDRLLADMEAARVSTPEYRRMQEAFGRGVTAQETDAGALGNQLMQRAMDKVAQGGQLSPEASRDAVQAARAGMASRGMATGSAGLAAEILNRDRFARAREMENLNFARDVQTEDLARRQTNTAMRAETDRFNIGLLGQSAELADAERARQLGLGQDAYNLSLSTNPRMMLAGLGSPYANTTSDAMQMVGGARGLEPMYSGGQLGSPGAFQTIMNTAGQFAQAGGQAYAASASDRRMKKDIKPVGKDGVLGLKTYEYRFKGESKDAPKHIGYMAQEVRKVMPEAVEEFNYRGKKRLAIKPAVIGQALTEALAEQQRNMFADGYVVGSGFGG